MTTAIVLKKVTKPMFLIGGLILLILGAFVMSSSQMIIGKEEDGGSGKQVSKPARIAFGLVIFLCGILITYKGISRNEIAAA